MLNKKYIIMLLLIIVGICAISTASATDDIESVAAADDSEALAVDEAVSEDIPTSLDEDLEKNIESDKEVISAPADDEKLSGPYSSLYTVSLESEYKISSYSSGKITGKINGYPSYMPESYLKLMAYDVNGALKYTSGKFSTSKSTFSITITKNTLLPGMYLLVAVDEGDIMAKSILKVTGQSTITANDYSSSYMSGATMYARITDAKNGKPLSALNVGVAFSNGKTTVTRYFYPNSNGEIAFEPPVGVGTWTVTIFPGFDYITGQTVKKATITKSSATISAHKVTGYKGFKTTLKATVKSHGRNVNEGTVKFKINGKSYKAPVKNGVATKKIKLKKLKKYKYTAKFLGTANLGKTKTAKAKAVLKNRQKVKMSFKNPVVYMGKTKKVVVKITSKGKKVKSGWLYIKHKGGVDKAPVKNGKVILYAVGLVKDHYRGSNGLTSYYKKTVSRSYWMKYAPTDPKYKPLKVKYKSTSKYKCPSCGKKRTHNHYEHGWYRTYVYHIKVS
ncbi:hypothetical protein [Methanobrevibacter sp.]|uniref:hypothetical protein n=1 Tax=Methanobrevibacter sp. TaxID=66852 RepID=UPI0038674F1B